MGKKKPAKEFDFDTFSAQLEQMATVDKPAPPPKESELLKVVRDKYDLLKSAIVLRGYTYRDVCTLLVSSGLERGVYPRALKEALVKVATERDEVWDDGRSKSNQSDSEPEESDSELEEIEDPGQPTLFDQIPQSSSTKSKKFVEIPQNI